MQTLLHLVYHSMNKHFNLSELLVTKREWKKGCWVFFSSEISNAFNKCKDTSCGLNALSWVAMFNGSPTECIYLTWNWEGLQGVQVSVRSQGECIVPKLERCWRAVNVK